MGDEISFENSNAVARLRAEIASFVRKVCLFQAARRSSASEAAVQAARGESGVYAVDQFWRRDVWRADAGYVLLERRVGINSPQQSARFADKHRDVAIRAILVIVVFVIVLNANRPDLGFFSVVDLSGAQLHFLATILH